MLQGQSVRLLNNFRSTPIMVGGVLYASNGVGLAEASIPKRAGRCGCRNQAPTAPPPIRFAAAPIASFDPVRDNLYSTSIVRVGAATGKRVWHYQTVHHDLFDDGNPAAPMLVDLTVDGKRITAAAQITKQSWVYVLDHVTGKPVWPIVEKPVPASTVPGEKASPTQPFPAKPPAFDRQGITEDDLIDFTRQLRAEALEIFKRYRTGPIFTPPSVAGEGPNDLKGTIELPGSIGGADWTGAAFDPETGILYVPSMTNPFVANLIPGDPKETNLRYRASTRELIQGPRGLPLVKPPYGRITAIDLNRGELKWTIANGGRSDQRAHAAERRRQEDSRLRQSRIQPSL